MSPFFENELIKEKGLLVGDKVMSPSHVINVLEKHMTDSRKEKIIDVVSKRTLRVSVVLEDIYDRGNASAVMRTAEALGVQNIHLIQKSDNFKEANRVTQGADKWLDVKIWQKTADCVSSLKSKGVKVVATTLNGGRPINELSFDKPTALVLGNERDGISDEMAELADERVFLPMNGFTQSFNISVAGALSMYHIMQNRKGIVEIDEKEELCLQALYFLKSVESSEKILLKAE